MKNQMTADEVIDAWNLNTEITDKEVLQDVRNACSECFDRGWNSALDFVKKEMKEMRMSVDKC